MIKDIVTNQTNINYKYLSLLITYTNTTTRFAHSQEQNFDI